MLDIQARARVTLVGFLCSMALGACVSPSPAAARPPVAVAPKAVAVDGEQRIAELGKCTLDSGETLAPCRIGYRTFGKLDAGKSNAVLFPTWFTGTSGKLVDVVPDKLVDTKRFYLILVDAIGNGVSSSPSNSPTQAHLRFPKFTIRDMVASQERLLREVLHIERLHTVMGMSMGGMQALEWAVSRPGMAAHVVSIVGTPQLTAQDLLLWNAEMHALEADTAYAHGEYQGHPKIRAVQDIHNMMLMTAGHRAANIPRNEFPAWLEKIESDTSFDWNDWHRQLEAMIAHDVAAPWGGNLEEAARRLRAKVLFVVAEHDQMVNPGPSKVLAKAAHARLEVLDGPCGHLAPGCEQPALARYVRAFMEE
ncbi:alpha/beta fold hydrolase [Pendulispora rubella]|uniref:Alpha/beta fold hydrolase n=1 Tax=Pendulispora rubella TaxID=2741070 RepID=A0ABZ2L357_9BACT